MEYSHRFRIGPNAFHTDCPEKQRIMDTGENKLQMARLLEHISKRWQLERKARRYGKQVVAMGSFFPYGQSCSQCGEQWPGAKDLAVRQWEFQV